MTSHAVPIEAIPSAIAGPAALRRFESIARELGEPTLVDDGRRLSERAAAGSFYVACVGQFKRGKSTLLDALMGRAVLPAGVVPVTAVPTVVRYGPDWSARVRFAGGEWRDVALEELGEYVTETGNPENRRGVAGVEVFAPSDILENGMCLVDTPGIGSVFAGNSEATRAFVPHVDAALVVLGADPPISGDELALIEQVAVQAEQLLVVLNKADRTSEHDRAAAATFTRGVLERRLGRSIGPVYEVSGLERLEGRGPLRDWPALAGALAQMARESGAEIARAAVRRGARRLSRQLLSVITLRREALTRPLEASDARTAALARAAGDVEQWLTDLGGVIDGEQRRLVADLETRRVAFVAAARRQGGPDLARRLAAIHAWWGPSVRREAMAAALDVARGAVTPWLAEQQQVAGAAFAERTARFRELAYELAQRVATMGVAEYAEFALPEEESQLAGKVTFQFQPLLYLARPASPLRHVADAALLAVGARRAILADAHRFLDWLLELNSSRVQADVASRLAESRAQLEGDVRARLRNLEAVARRAIDRAVVVRAAGEEHVRAELQRLGALEREVEELEGTGGVECR